MKILNSFFKFPQLVRGGGGVGSAPSASKVCMLICCVNRPLKHVIKHAGDWILGRKPNRIQLETEGT